MIRTHKIWTTKVELPAVISEGDETLGYVGIDMEHPLAQKNRAAVMTALPAILGVVPGLARTCVLSFPKLTPDQRKCWWIGFFGMPEDRLEDLERRAEELAFILAKAAE